MERQAVRERWRADASRPMTPPVETRQLACRLLAPTALETAAYLDSFDELMRVITPLAALHRDWGEQPKAIPPGMRAQVEQTIRHAFPYAYQAFGMSVGSIL
jgi:hypothetical protein